MTAPQFLILAPLTIGYIAGRRFLLTWVARRWAEERISNLTAVLIILVTSGLAIGPLFMLALAALRPSGASAIILTLMLFSLLVVFGFAMTAMNYASTHGVREHLGAQRERLQAKD